MDVKKLDLILKEIQEVKQEQKEMRAEQKEMKQDQQAMSQSLKAVQSEQKSMQLGQQSMKQELQDMKSQMNSRFDTIETILSTHGERFNVIEQKLDVVYEQTANNAEDVGEIKKGQMKQDKTIEVLSRRSLDQEADIKRMHV